MENLKIRSKLKKAGVFAWELAEKMEIAEMTLSRKLRRELPEEEQEKIFKLIEEIATVKSNKNM